MAGELLGAADVQATGEVGDRLLFSLQGIALGEDAFACAVRQFGGRGVDMVSRRPGESPT
jgi:hypothetical protein